MDNTVRIPMFPLAILPLPGELVPLHIFEPRYRQLLLDAETKDITFGIYFSHEINKQQIGSLMRLESVIKRYDTGESDIIVKCQDNFTLDKLYRTYRDKMYPGGDVVHWKTDMEVFPNQRLYESFTNYLKGRNITSQYTVFTLFQLANELNLDVNDRYKFLQCSETEREAFLMNRIKFLTYLIEQEQRSKDIYHLN